MAYIPISRATPSPPPTWVIRTYRNRIFRRKRNSRRESAYDAGMISAIAINTVGIATVTLFQRNCLNSDGRSTP
jgi:DNA-directed RNA polymerase specialized sigma24 family protein